MEEFQTFLEKAKRHLKVADRMIYVTYPVVKDNKLLMIVMENLFLSLTNAITALMSFLSSPSGPANIFVFDKTPYITAKNRRNGSKKSKNPISLNVDIPAKMIDCSAIFISPTKFRKIFLSVWKESCC